MIAQAGAPRGTGDDESNDVTRRFSLQLEDLSHLSHLLSTNLFNAAVRKRSREKLGHTFNLRAHHKQYVSFPIGE